VTELDNIRRRASSLEAVNYCETDSSKDCQVSYLLFFLNVALLEPGCFVTHITPKSLGSELEGSTSSLH
jgi:hypothetical protein